MIEINAEQIERAQRLLRHIPDGAPKAMSRALNRAVETAKTEASRKIRETYYIKHRDVMATIEIKKSNPESLMAGVISTGGPIALSKFKVNPSRPAPKRRSPIIVRVKRGSGGPIAHAFVAQKASGYVGVFVRAGRQRFPIDQKYGPSVPQMMGNESVTRWVEEKARETLDRRLNHEINRLLGGS